MGLGQLGNQCCSMHCSELWCVKSSTASVAKIARYYPLENTEKPVSLIELMVWEETVKVATLGLYS